MMQIGEVVIGMGKEKLLNIINKFNKKRVIVIGDIMLDEYLIGDIKGKSPEAPVLLLKIKDRKYYPGGAGNAAVNLASLGAKVYLVGLKGKDAEGSILDSLFRINKVNVDGILDEKKHTTLKTRLISENQHIVRYDSEETNPVTPSITFNLFEFIKKRIKNIDGILISDYDKGICTTEFVQSIIKLCNAHKKPVVVDSKAMDYKKFFRATCFTPNLYDASLMTGKDSTYPIVIKLSKDLDSDIFMTAGPKGIILCERDSDPQLIPTKPIDKCDTTGAGDTVSAMLLLAKCSNASNLEAIDLAQSAARVVIQKQGTASVKPEELINEINNS